jgi:hypothetical protein
MSPNDKTKKSATMNETDTNKLFLDIEKKESIQSEMVSIEPKNNNNTNISTSTTVIHLKHYSFQPDCHL